jgi:hypothetical protein
MPVGLHVQTPLGRKACVSPHLAAVPAILFNLSQSSSASRMPGRDYNCLLSNHRTSLATSLPPYGPLSGNHHESQMTLWLRGGCRRDYSSSLMTSQHLLAAAQRRTFPMLDACGTTYRYGSRFESGPDRKVRQSRPATLASSSILRECRKDYISRRFESGPARAGSSAR